MPTTSATPTDSVTSSPVPSESPTVLPTAPSPQASSTTESPSPPPPTVTHTVTATATVAAQPEPSVLDPVVRDVGLGSTVTMRHFEVTVSDVRRNGDGTAIAVSVKVCYTHPHSGANADGTTRVSRDPWSFGLLDAESMESEYTFVKAREIPISTHWTPVYNETRLSPGQCNEGWLAVHHGNPDLWISYIRYAPADFGDRVTWSLDG